MTKQVNSNKKELFHKFKLHLYNTFVQSFYYIVAQQINRILYRLFSGNKICSRCATESQKLVTMHMARYLKSPLTFIIKNTIKNRNTHAFRLIYGSTTSILRFDIILVSPQASKAKSVYELPHKASQNGKLTG